MLQGPGIQTVELSSDGTIGKSVVKFNGEPIEGVITAIGISLSAKDGMPKVYLEMDVVVLVYLQDMIDVKMVKRTHDMLVAMGWTPPPLKESEKDG